MHAPTQKFASPVSGVAIIGMGCVLPGGIDSPEMLWRFLCEGRDAITAVPPDRWNADLVYDPDPSVPGKAVTRWGGFVRDIAAFDPAFFGISPREAAMMDPQQRMLLETAWRALEDAGLRLDAISGSRTGVYVGISHSDYHEIQKFGRYEIDVHTSTGGALSIAANRLSHRFDLRGPSLSVDTACSSSLVALDLACTSLSTGECEMALVGGVNAILTPDVTITFSRATMLSPDGRCKAFDSRANGYVRGEGAGVVVLKPVARALADGDRIRAVIRGTAVNQDGRTTTITVPSLTAQIAMLREACRRSSVDPREVRYVEAHGTGTPVGDPIEAEAIGTVFGTPGAIEDRCRFGSIKSNIGHLEPAAGIAGLIKAALCVERGQIPPSLHIETVNPRIPLEDLGIEVCRQLAPFPDSVGPRLAAVNSFGFGGTNACAVVQQAPPPKTAPPARGVDDGPILVPLTAASSASLRAIATEIADRLEGGAVTLPDLAGTLALRRTHLEHRAVVIAQSPEEATVRLRMLADAKPDADVIIGRRSADSRSVFVFTGQGAQWWGMGRELFDRDAVFRASFEACDALLFRRSGQSLVEELRRGEAESRIDQTIVAQPMTFALQVGLAARWKAWGIAPQAVIGHSIGEIAAAHVAGALTLEQAIDVVYHRSRLQEQTRFQGGMAAIGMSPDALRRLLQDRQIALEIAAVNAPELTTVAGDRAELDRLVAMLEAEGGTFARVLRVDYAFHTRQMGPFEDELRRSLGRLASHAAAIPMFSTVTGRAIGPGELDADYWWRNMRETVQFRAAVDAAIDAGFNGFIELGAHPVLGGPVRSCLGHRGVAGTVLASLQRETGDDTSLARALAELYVTGLSPDWATLATPGWQFVTLPPQPFERTLCWAEAEESRSARFDRPAHPLLGFRLKTVAPRWQSHVSAAMPRFLGDHQVDGAVVFPAAGYVELMLAAAREALGEAPWEIEALSFHDALVLTSDTIVLLETSLELERGTIVIASQPRGGDGAWTRRASARIRNWHGHEARLAPWRPKIEPPAHVERARFYRRLKQDGHDFGPAFRGVQTLWHERGEALGLVTPPAEAGALDGYLLHPAVLDACFHVIRGFRDMEGSDGTLALPYGIDRVRYFRSPDGPLFSRATAISETPSEIASDISIINEVGQVVALIQGFRCHRIRRTNEHAATAASSFYQEQWIKLPALDAAEPPLAARLSGKTWLLLADRSGVSKALAALIRSNGGEAWLVYPGPTFRSLGHNAFETTIDGAGLLQVLQQITAPIDDIVHLWTLDAASDAASSDAVGAGRELGTEALIFLVQAVARSELNPRMAVVTADAVLLDTDEAQRVRGIGIQAAIIGAARSIRNESPDRALRVFDIARTTSAACLLDELVAQDPETEVALRGELRFGCRLIRRSPDSFGFGRKDWIQAAHAPPFHLTMRAPGQLDNLTLRERPLPPLRSGDVLIEVHAAGLNFRDVMAATGLLPPEAEAAPAWQHLGFECAGVVTAVGEGVDPALAGTRVAAVTPGAFASHVAVPAPLVFAIPDNLSFAQAAAVPTAYLTAHYALKTLGRIAPGDRILIHAAAGGVGLAAVAIARQAGADIFATAGSPEKRAHLRHLGVAHVFDSRSLSFADDVLATTDGRGVDLVLNSLPGAYLEKSLSVLAPGGRFLEIGKRDIYADTPIGLRSLRQNIAFFAIDLARLAAERPALLRPELESVLASLARHEIELLPITEFGLGDIAGAFRHMARGKHMGKIVISYAGAAAIEADGSATAPVRTDATYLITGGLGGLGLATARWLIDQGARSLALIGRRGATQDESAVAVAEMRAAGCEVLVFAADVADRDQVAQCLARIAADAKPLRGIVHAAGVIDDGMAVDLDRDRIRRVFDPKVLGARHLHELTDDTPLDFFVCYSSIAAGLGSVGQAHYAAANRVLDALCNVRRARRLAALSVAWGPIADVGFLTRRTDVARYLGQIGLEAMPLSDVLDALRELLVRDCAAVAFGNVQWSVLARNSAEVGSPRLSGLAVENARPDRPYGSLRGQLLAAPAEQRAALLTEFVREQIGAVLKVQPQSVDLERPLTDSGLDSLTSFELKNRVETALGLSLPISKFLQRPTASDLANAIAEKLDQPEEDGLKVSIAEAADAEPAMSIGQEALWFTEQLDRDSPAYGLAMCISVRPQLDPDLVDAALQRVVARHASLRLSFPADATGPLPSFLDAAAFKLNYHDAVAWDEPTFRRRLDREANRPFNLSRDPLLRLHLYRRADCDVLLLHVHHIAADAASIVICVEQMFHAYFALQAGVKVTWSRPALPVSTYVNWQRKVAEGPSAAAHMAFWRGQLAGAAGTIALPTDLARPPEQRGPGNSRSIRFPRELGRKLKALAAQEGQTLFTLLLTAFNVLLHRASGDTDIVVGIPAHGRVRPEFADAIGYFVNPVPIRTRLDRSGTYRSLIAGVGSTVRAALDHQELPFARIVRDLGVPREPGRAPIFQVMFSMERPSEIDTHGFASTLLNTEGASIAIRDFKIESIAVKRDRAQFDLTFVMEEFDDQILGVIDYRTDLWQSTTIDGFVAQYTRILEQIAQAPDQAPDQAVGSSALPDAAGAALRGDVIAQFPDVMQAIRSAAAAAPGRRAVEWANGFWTYRQLLDRIAAVAMLLATRGVTAQSLVAVAVGRSGDLIAAILGILELGAAYVPLDTTHPPARLARALADAAPSVVIADRAGAAALATVASCPIVLLDDIAAQPPARIVQSDKHEPGASDLAYVIYTSGSTGRPVGVEVRREALSNFLSAMACELPLSGDDTLLAVTTIGFDIAVLELLLPLTLGGRVVIADEATTRDGRRLGERLRRGDITAMQGTPATWRMLIDAGWNGGVGFTALVGGERLQRRLADEILSRAQGGLWNLYGPTETTIWSTCAQVLAGAADISIGRPIANTTCHVVDDEMRPVPDGTPGELLIGGLGLARGYCNDVELTAARFVPDPSDPAGGARCFRTGDVVRVTDGALTFIGRRDQQIKLRGFRIELGEIEAMLCSHPAVRDAVALLEGGDLDTARIVAFVVRDRSADAQVAAEEHALRSHLQQHVPPYMVPASIATLARLPRLANGKIDRAELARMSAAIDRERPLIKPRNDVEARLASLLEEIIGAADISVDDDFFSLGGTSLLAMRYLARVSDVFQVELGAADLMRAPTVAGFAELILRRQAVTAHATAPGARVSAKRARALWRPLAVARAEAQIGDIDAAAIAYLPDDLAQLAAGRAAFVAVEHAASDALWLGLCRLGGRTIALVLAPVSGRGLFADPALARRSIDRSVAFAARLGAPCVALTGLIPAVTDFGRTITAPESVALTTGHAATACAIGLTIQAAARATARELHDETMCFVGLGAIGTAALRTLLGRVGHPGGLILCDVPAKRGHLEALVREVRAVHGFRGPIEIAISGTSLADTAYQSRFFVGATNMPGVLDVERLRPGSIVIDDSFPFCFDLAAAQRRFERAGDILCLAGGSVRLPEALDWDLALPPAILALAREREVRSFVPAGNNITGCILSALLPAIAGLRPTIGAVTFDDCVDYWDGMARAGVGAATLHCGTWLPTALDLQRFAGAMPALAEP